MFICPVTVMVLYDVITELGGSTRNTSTRPFEPLQQEAKRLPTNGKNVHLQFTKRQNVREALARMASGDAWAALEVSDSQGRKVVIGERQVCAGPRLIRLLQSVPSYMSLCPAMQRVGRPCLWRA